MKEQTITPDDKAETVSGRNLADQIEEIMKSLSNIRANVKTLKNISDTASTIGGAMPCRIQAVFAKDENGNRVDCSDTALSDEGFATIMRTVKRSNGDVIQRMVAFASEARTMKAHLDNTDNRIVKLRDRARRQRTGAEHTTANEMVKRMKAARKVLESRLRILLDSFFDERKRVLKAVENMSRSVDALFVGGSPLLRESILAHGGSTILEGIAVADSSMRTGKRNQRTCKI